MAKMKAYATFDLYLADRPPRHRALIRALRALVKRVSPDLVESVKWSNGCWLLDGAPVAYVHADVDHVHFGFLRGAELRDPGGLLRGEARFVRHVKVRTLRDIDRAAFAALLAQAVRLGPVPGTFRKDRAKATPAAAGKGRAARDPRRKGARKPRRA